VNAQQDRKLRELVEDLQGPDIRPLPALRPEEPRGGIPSRRGYVERAYQPGSDSGETTAGIASPLTEGQGQGLELARTYHDPVVMFSSDGLFVWEVAPVATIQFRDANGAPAEFRLAIPTEPDP